jgi:nitrate reductase gamma subunit
VALVGLGVLLVVRCAQTVARRLSRASDFLILGCLVVVFLSGFLAAHPALNPFPWSAVLLVHLLSGDLVLAMLPFTKLVHVGLLPLAQLVSEVGWRFTPDGGERVVRALGKENEPI